MVLVQQIFTHVMISMMLFRTFGQIPVINLTSAFHKFLCLYAHADGEGFFFGNAFFGGEFADFLRDLH